MKSFVLALPLLVLCMAFATTSVSLDRKAKVGETGAYSLHFDFKIPSGTGTFKANATEVTKAATADGFEVERSYKDVVVSSQGSDFPRSMPSYVLEYAPNGKVKVVAGDETTPDTVRFMRLWSFVAPGKPVDAGDTWKFSEPEDKDSGRPAFEVTFSMDGKDSVAGFDVARVSYTAKEAGGGSAKGTFWIDTENGATVKVDTEITDAANAGGKIGGHLVYLRKTR